MFPVPDTESVRMRDAVKSVLTKGDEIQADMDDLLGKAMSLEEQCTTSPPKERVKAADKLYEVQEELRKMLNTIEGERFKAGCLRMRSQEMQYQEAVEALDKLNGLYEAYKSAAWEHINAHPVTPSKSKLPFDPHTYVRHNGDGSVYLDTPEMRREYWMDMDLVEQEPTSYERVLEENIAMWRAAKQNPELLGQWRAHPETRREFRRQLSAQRDEEIRRAPRGDPARRPRLDWW